ncbi:Asp23/Gls24 family envelope stress response protein [Marisediminicola sp. LYQ134]|uniref:Asp23/Gls24 family envelope stress response protein n=1 Tax=Marisediminicola sp. LYQ134 TaxID=3391061 RepID=UPI00398358CF
MTDSRHRVTPIDLGPAGSADSVSPQLALERAIAVTVLGTTGVYTLGTPFARFAGSLAGRVGADTIAGVRTSTDKTGTVVDVAIVAEYPANVTELADTVRTQIEHTVRQTEGDHVTVNVEVTDVHGPFDPIETDEDPEAEAADTEKTDTEKTDADSTSADEQDRDSADEAQDVDSREAPAEDVSITTGGATATDSPVDADAVVTTDADGRAHIDIVVVTDPDSTADADVDADVAPERGRTD